jgi:formate dehydrogenase subunit delta
MPPHVRLVNEIAVQFHHRPAGEAAAAIATHVRTFWDPRMRAALLAHVDAGGADLDPLAVAAAGLLRSGAPR